MPSTLSWHPMDITSFHIAARCVCIDKTSLVIKKRWAGDPLSKGTRIAQIYFCDDTGCLLQGFSAFTHLWLAWSNVFHSFSFVIHLYSGCIVTRKCAPPRCLRNTCVWSTGKVSLKSDIWLWSTTPIMYPFHSFVDWAMPLINDESNGICRNWIMTF